LAGVGWENPGVIDADVDQINEVDAQLGAVLVDESFAYDSTDRSADRGWNGASADEAGYEGSGGCQCGDDQSVFAERDRCRIGGYAHSSISSSLGPGLFKPFDSRPSRYNSLLSKEAILRFSQTINAITAAKVNGSKLTEGSIIVDRSPKHRL